MQAFILNSLNLIFSFGNALLYILVLFWAWRLVDLFKIEAFFTRVTRSLRFFLILAFASLVFAPLNFVYNRWAGTILSRFDSNIIRAERLLEAILLLVVLVWLWKRLQGSKEEASPGSGGERMNAKLANFNSTSFVIAFIPLSYFCR